MKKNIAISRIIASNISEEPLINTLVSNIQSRFNLIFRSFEGDFNVLSEENRASCVTLFEKVFFHDKPSALRLFQLIKENAFESELHLQIKAYLLTNAAELVRGICFEKNESLLQHIDSDIVEKLVSEDMSGFYRYLFTQQLSQNIEHSFWNEFFMCNQTFRPELVVNFLDSINQLLLDCLSHSTEINLYLKLLDHVQPFFEKPKTLLSSLKPKEESFPKSQILNKVRFLTLGDHKELFVYWSNSQKFFVIFKDSSKKLQLVLTDNGRVINDNNTQELNHVFNLEKPEYLKFLRLALTVKLKHSGFRLIVLYQNE